VVHHDFRLNPGYARDEKGNWLEGITPRIRDMTLAELRRFDVSQPRPGSEYARAHPGVHGVDGERIPTLAEVVALAAKTPHFCLLVELKCDGSSDSADPIALADAALAVIEQANFLDRAIFVGFDWRALARVKQKQPVAKIWCTTDENIKADAALFEIVKSIGGEGWFPYFARLTTESAALARSHGLKIAAWTVNDEDNMRALMALGVDAICTDRPDLLCTLHGRP
jgi:glycerophosphoryl diester phosphodiesterase